MGKPSLFYAAVGAATFLAVLRFDQQRRLRLAEAARSLKEDAAPAEAQQKARVRAQSVPAGDLSPSGFGFGTDQGPFDGLRASTSDKSSFPSSTDARLFPQNA